MPNSHRHPATPFQDRPASAVLTIWLLSDDKAGTVNQARGVAERLAELLPQAPQVSEHIAHARFPFNRLPARLWGLFGPTLALAALIPSLSPPWPDLVIAAGRSAVAPAAAIRQMSGMQTQVVALQNPRLPLQAFDLVIAPVHDGLAGANLLAIDGAPHRISPARLAEAASEPPPALKDMRAAATAAGKPFVAVLLGGNSARYNFDNATAHRLATDLAKLAATGVRFALTASRRTPPEAVEILQSALAPYPHFFWDGSGANPYLALLALADHLLVTGDSVSMLSEAASTGRPVHRIDLPGQPGKFAAFHGRLEALGLVRPFTGNLPDFTPPPFDETGRAAAAVLAVLMKARAGAFPPGQKSV
ncbi:MAG: mitochondrial fission ELM1 family protein [Elstera sp.]